MHHQEKPVTDALPGQPSAGPAAAIDGEAVMKSLDDGTALEPHSQDARIPQTAAETSSAINPASEPPNQHTWASSPASPGVSDAGPSQTIPTDLHITSDAKTSDTAKSRPDLSRAGRTMSSRSFATSMATSDADDQMERARRPEKPQALWRCLINRNLPAPLPQHSEMEAPLMPRYTASWLSKVTFTWIQPLITLGYQRFLVKEDLWKLGPEDESSALAEKVIHHFERRLKNVRDWNEGIDNGTIKVTGVKRMWWRARRKRKDFKKDVPGLEWAISDTFFTQFWSAGLYKIVSDTLNITSPLVTRKIITFGTERYLAARNVPGYTATNLGVGFGWAVLLLFMQLIASFTMHAFFAQSMTVGVMARGALIAGLYRRAVNLSGKARATITSGKLVNHISTDISRIDFASGFFHMSWTAPIQLLIVIGILCQQMGATALTGVAFVLIMTPLQGIAMRKMFGLRQKAMVWTDKRAKLIQELLGGMRILKFFAWEDPYLERVGVLRRSELTKIRTLLVLRAGTMAVAMSLPALATVIAFTAYAYTGNNATNPATIFTSLTLFNLLRMPLMMLPVALATATDAKNAFNRLREVFLAEQLEQTYVVDAHSKYALTVENASFLWETSPPKEEDEKKSKGSKAKEAAKQKKADKAALKAEAKRDKTARTRIPVSKPAEVQAQTSQLSQKMNTNMAEEQQSANEVHDSEALVRNVTDAVIPVPAPSPDSSESSNTRRPSIDSAGQHAEKTSEKIGLDVQQSAKYTSETPRDPQVKDVTLRIPRGQLCAIVGPVGSGKSSLLSGLIGEMKTLQGNVTFGGSVGYCAQQAWIQNATL